MKFIHTAPLQLLSITDDSKLQMVYAQHLSNKKYYDYFNDKKDCKLILNTCDIHDLGNLITYSNELRVEYIILPNYPACDTMETIEASMKLGKVFKEMGFKIMYAPQSIVGDMDDLIYGFQHAITSDWIDNVMISQQTAELVYDVSDDNRLKHNSRIKLMYELESNTILKQLIDKNKKIHLHGLNYGHSEIISMIPFKRYINSWDSSTAIQLGIDNEPITDKYRNDKYDINISTENTESLAQVNDNIEYIDNLIKEYYIMKESANI